MFKRKLLLGLAAAVFAITALCQSSDGLGPSSSPAFTTWNYLFNGTTWDRWKGGTVTDTSASISPLGVAKIQLFAFTSTGSIAPLFNGTATGDAANGGGGLSIAPLIYNGASWDRQRTPVIFKNLSAVLITAESTIWTPAAGKKFRLMGYCLAQGVVTGAVTLKDNTAGTTILIIPQNTIGVPNCQTVGNGILSTTINNVLTATGASTETITGYVFGTEE